MGNKPSQQNTQQDGEPSPHSGDGGISAAAAVGGDDMTDTQKKVKLLLLGAGESGKSTIFKLMRIWYGGPISDDELRMYGVVIRMNIVVAVNRLCMVLRNHGLEGSLDEESNEYSGGMTPRQAFDEIVAYLLDQSATHTQDENESKEIAKDWVGRSDRTGLAANNNSILFLQHWPAIKVLWQSNTMKEVWAKRATMNVIDGHKEYLQDLPRIASPTYKPSTQDILQSRWRTNQIVMERYRIDGIDFHIYDCPGIRSQRRQWIDFFDSVDAVIFVAAISEYDQFLVESKRVNRVAESIDLFRSVINHRAFLDSSIILFLNKKDIFAEKFSMLTLRSRKVLVTILDPRKTLIMAYCTLFKSSKTARLKTILMIVSFMLHVLQMQIA